jgi:hypothetical protein
MAFLVGAGFRAVAWSGVQLGRPEPWRPEGVATTNELDAGERRPMIGSGEEPCWLSVAGGVRGSSGWLPGMSGWSGHLTPIRRLPGLAGLHRRSATGKHVAVQPAGQDGVAAVIASTRRTTRTATCPRCSSQRDRAGQWA